MQTPMQTMNHAYNMQTLQSRQGTLQQTKGSMPRMPQQSFNMQLAQSADLAGTTGQQISQPTEFQFEFNFDEHGALYFLGSMGKKKLWQNPHALGQV